MVENFGTLMLWIFAALGTLLLLWWLAWLSLKVIEVYLRVTKYYWLFLAFVFNRRGAKRDLIDNMLRLADKERRGGFTGSWGLGKNTDD